MTDFFIDLLRSFLALGIVLVIVLLVLPYFPKVLSVLKLPTHSEGSHVNIKRVIPISRWGSLVEMEIKNKLYVVYFTNTSATILYKEDEKDNSINSSP